MPLVSLVTQQVGGEMVLLNQDSGIYYTLNGLGAFIWARVAHGATAAEVVAAVEAEYEVAEDRAVRDVRVFLDRLVELGLLTTR